jgi:hypothetical protein
MAQGSEFPLKKPPGFHYDFFLLGIMTFLAGLIGLPAPNGLIPQAPIHTQSLVVRGFRKKDDEEDGLSKSEKSEKTAGEAHVRGLLRDEPIAVVEQRVSNLAQGALCLVLLTRPFLHVLGLIPRGVLAGLFWHMGLDALTGNGITTKIIFLLRDPALQHSHDPLLKVRKSRIAGFVFLQLLGFGATFGIVQNPLSAIGFPVLISLFIAIRTLLIPHLPFREEELNILDQPTASPFVSIISYSVHLFIESSLIGLIMLLQIMASVGGSRI